MITKADLAVFKMALDLMDDTAKDLAALRANAHEIEEAMQYKEEVKRLQMEYMSRESV